MGSGRKPRRQVFSQWGSYDNASVMFSKVRCTCTAWFVWVCRKPQRPVFSQWGSYDDAIISKVSCTARFVWGLVGNPEDRFSHNEVNMIMQSLMFSEVRCTCTARIVWGLVGNPEDRFSHNEAHMKMQSLMFSKVS